MKALSTNSKRILLFVLFLQFTLDITVLFDVPVVRQVIGFLCLTFIPGFIILKLLKFDKLDNLELVLFSAGFSRGRAHSCNYNNPYDGRIITANLVVIGLVAREHRWYYMMR